MKKNEALTGQYLAALAMMRGAIESCPDELWDASVGRHPFWLIAYHGLYYTDLYLNQNETTFAPPEFGRPDEHYMEKRPRPPHERIEIGEPYSKEQLLGYADHCRQRIISIVSAETAETLAAAAEFSWIPFSRLELHLYNMRHLQHHVAQLSLELKFQTGAGVDWIGVADDKDSQGG